MAAGHAFFLAKQQSSYHTNKLQLLIVLLLFNHHIEKKFQHKIRAVNLDYSTNQDVPNLIDPFDPSGLTHTHLYLAHGPCYPIQTQLSAHIVPNQFGSTQTHTFSHRDFFDYLSNILLKLFLNKFIKIQLIFNSFATDPSGPTQIETHTHDPSGALHTQTQTHDPSGPAHTQLTSFACTQQITQIIIIPSHPSQSQPPLPSPHPFQAQQPPPRHPILGQSMVLNLTLLFHFRLLLIVVWFLLNDKSLSCDGDQLDILGLSSLSSFSSTLSFYYESFNISVYSDDAACPSSTSVYSDDDAKCPSST